MCVVWPIKSLLAMPLATGMALAPSIDMGLK